MNRWIKALILIGFPALVFGSGLLLLNWLGRSTLAGGEKPLYVRSGYNAEDTKEYWDALDQAGILSVESRLLKLDLFFPLLYGGALLISVLAAWMAMGRPPFWNFAVIPIWLAALADWTENSLLLYLLQSYMNSTTAALNPDLVQIASTATMLKFIFIAISWVAFFILVGKFLRDGRRM
ncbi:MAG TPA: hypothetical protein VMJ90_04715 [Anaerolineales bacterium]|nr:hypothetical protein [Anaerolineales bacterium]